MTRSMMVRTVLAVALALSGVTAASAFVPALPSFRASGSTAVSVFGAAGKKPSGPTPPKFDKTTQKWEATYEEEGYGPAGSLLRFGPKPFLTRLSNPEMYEQAVLKYQAQEKCDRIEAQGNMDFYFENANDWAVQKMEEKNGAAKRDYSTIDTKQLVLTLVWGVFVTGVIGRLVTLIASGEYAASMKSGGVILL